MRIMSQTSTNKSEGFIFSVFEMSVKGQDSKLKIPFDPICCFLKAKTLWLKFSI